MVTIKIVHRTASSSSSSSRRGSSTMTFLLWCWLFVTVMLLFSMTKVVSATKTNIRGTRLDDEVVNYEEKNRNNHDNSGADKNRKVEEEERRRHNRRALLEHVREENPASSMEYVQVGSTRDSSSNPSSSSHHHNNNNKKGSSNESSFSSSSTTTTAITQPNIVSKQFIGIERVDRMGMTHTRFEATMNDIPIFGQEQIIHHKPGSQQHDRITETVMDPRIEEIMHNLNMEPTLKMEDAIAAAEAYLQGQQQEGSVISILDGTVLNVLPMTREVYLTYKVPTKIVDSEGNMVGKPYVFVNAHSSPANGDAARVVKVLETLCTALLKDADKVTRYQRKGKLTNGEKRFPIGDSSDLVLADIHRFVQYTLDFLATPLVQFDSYDDQGAQVKAVGHYGRNFVNAFWDGRKLVFGDGDGVVEGPQGVLDVVAHEIGHAVTEFSSGLIYENESGAINEAASDILGAAVETFVIGQVTEKTWLFSEDSVLEEGVAVRYMDRPSDDGYSRDHYSNRYVGSQDNGGVHSNSGIVNHWFYLLVVGGQHHNPRFQSGNIVIGIGMDTAFDIWFQAWTSELTPTSNMHDARDATILACEDLGYDVNMICASVKDAWDEVGVVE